MIQDRITKLARGQPCMVRLPYICNFNPDTTVLAHVRIAGISGMGIKAPSIIGAWACSACHAVCDGQQHSDLTASERRLALLEGMARTQAKLIEMGKLKW